MVQAIDSDCYLWYTIQLMQYHVYILTQEDAIMRSVASVLKYIKPPALQSVRIATVLHVHHVFAFSTFIPNHVI